MENLKNRGRSWFEQPDGQEPVEVEMWAVKYLGDIEQLCSTEEEAIAYRAEVEEGIEDWTIEIEIVLVDREPIYALDYDD